MCDDGLIPRHTSDYSTKQYWDWRYLKETDTNRHYDWCLEYSHLKDFLAPHLKPSDRILMVGCGNSKLSEDLYADGFETIVNIDYSASVIQMMSDKTRDTCPRMIWEEMDMRDLSVFDEGLFDVVLDKCALDAIWSDGGSLWDPSDSTRSSIETAVKEFYRVLKPGGKFLLISFGQPHFRKPLLSIVGWEIECIEIGMFFMYIMQK